MGQSTGVPNGITFHVGITKYSLSNVSVVNARNNLISKGWIITDGGGVEFKLNSKLTLWIEKK